MFLPVAHSPARNRAEHGVGPPGNSGTDELAGLDRCNCRGWCWCCCPWLNRRRRRGHARLGLGRRGGHGVLLLLAALVVLVLVFFLFTGLGGVDPAALRHALPPGEGEDQGLCGMRARGQQGDVRAAALAVEREQEVIAGGRRVRRPQATAAVRAAAGAGLVGPLGEHCSLYWSCGECHVYSGEPLFGASERAKGGRGLIGRGRAARLEKRSSAEWYDAHRTPWTVQPKLGGVGLRSMQPPRWGRVFSVCSHQSRSAHSLARTRERPVIQCSHSPLF